MQRLLEDQGCPHTSSKTWRNARCPKTMSYWLSKEKDVKALTVPRKFRKSRAHAGAGTSSSLLDFDRRPSPGSCSQDAGILVDERIQKVKEGNAHSSIDRVTAGTEIHPVRGAASDVHFCSSHQQHCKPASPHTKASCGVCRWRDSCSGRAEGGWDHGLLCNPFDKSRERGCVDLHR